MTSPTPEELRALGAAGLVAEREQVGWALWNLTDAQLPIVRQLPTLCALNLFETCESGEVTDAGLAAVAGHAGLRQLQLGPGVTDAGLAHVAGLKALERLRLDSAAGVTDAGMKHVAVLAELRQLSLQFTAVTDAGLGQLAGLTALRELELNDTGVTDAGLPHLLKMTALEKLTLGSQPSPFPVSMPGRARGGITDAALAALPRHPALRYVSVAGPLTANGLSALGLLPQLRTLLVTAPLDDAAVAVLGALRGLTQLYVTSHAMTKAGVARLKQALPSCQVVA